MCSLKDGIKFRGCGGRKFQEFFCPRVEETDVSGMQGQALKLIIPAVFSVPQNRVAQISQMDTQLVRPAGKRL